MRSTVRFPTVLKLGLALSLALPGIAGSAWAKRPAPKPPAAKKSAQEISSTDDALQKQMDWENKILGPNTEKKIDLGKIQKLQAEETARRDKQEKIDKAEKERRDREAERTAAAQRNVHAPSSRDMPEIEEAPPPPPKVEKHDDAFVDRLLKEKGTTKKKSAAATNDEVDELLNATKQDKPGVAAKNKGGKVDTVDQLLATADKQPTIKTTTKRPSVTDEPVSAEAAAREAAMKAIAAAQAKADEDRSRNRKPIVPDAAMLRGRAEANARANPPPAPSRQAASGPTRAGWNDPFAGEDSDAPATSRRSKVTTAVRPPSPPAEMDLDPTPAPRRSSARPGSRSWKDPFDAGEGVPAPKARPLKSAPAGKSKHPANWKDPFA